MPLAICPECDYEINLPSPKERQRVLCSNCDSELEVISLYPLELDWVYDDLDDDDWDDDDWGDDD